MRIVQIAAEFAPIAKAGGLGEVLLGLTRELTAQFHDVTAIIPKYSFIPAASLPELRIEAPDLRCTLSGQSVSNTVWAATVEGCQVKLIEARHPSGFFNHDKIYGYDDDVPRFLYFCRAALEYLQSQNTPIDLLHLHDWHAAACAPLVRDLLKNLHVKGILLTIHNLEYQGKCAARDLDAIGLQGAAYLTPDKLQDPHYPESINLLKGGIVYANAVNTVSATHAKEILTPQMGFGLDRVLAKKKPFGIINGLDAKIWNPNTDPHLPVRYGPGDAIATILSSKKKNRELLKLSDIPNIIQDLAADAVRSPRFADTQAGAEAGHVKDMADGRGCKDGASKCVSGQILNDVRYKPLVAVVSRLVPQKGIELIERSVELVLKLGGSFALLGSSPMPDIQKQFNDLQQHYKGYPDVALQYEYNEALSHRLFAAADFLLVPSLFEPCGLTQIIALRYGAIPIVRATGGLKDTVFDCENYLVPLAERNGFVFKEPTVEALQDTLSRAFAFYNSDPATAQAMMQRSMKKDYGWHQPAKQYVRLYNKILGIKEAVPAQIRKPTPAPRF